MAFAISFFKERSNDSAMGRRGVLMFVLNEHGCANICTVCIVIKDTQNMDSYMHFEILPTLQLQ
jgi:hypothetical protein